MRRAGLAAATLAAAAALVAACGDGTGPPPPATTAEPPAATRLEIVFGAEIRAVPSTFSQVLRCGPAGGAVLDPEAACRRLEENPDLLEAPADAGACDAPPEEWEVRVTGTHEGRRVDVRFDRCHRAEVARWMAVVDFDIPEPGI